MNMDDMGPKAQPIKLYKGIYGRVTCIMQYVFPYGVHVVVYRIRI